MKTTLIMGARSLAPEKKEVTQPQQVQIQQVPQPPPPANFMVVIGDGGPFWIWKLKTNLGNPSYPYGYTFRSTGGITYATVAQARAEYLSGWGIVLAPSSGGFAGGYLTKDTKVQTANGNWYYIMNYGGNAGGDNYVCLQFDPLNPYNTPLTNPTLTLSESSFVQVVTP